jgi:hypothetical protein
VEHVCLSSSRGTEMIYEEVATEEEEEEEEQEQ